jgi:subtilisin family serine protease
LPGGTRQLRHMRYFWRYLCALCALIGLAAPASAAPARPQPSLRAWPGGAAVVGYQSPEALRRALSRFPARVVRHLPALDAVEVHPVGGVREFAAAVSRLDGIAYVERLVPRIPTAEPSLAPAPYQGGTYEWQFKAAGEELLPASVLRAAAAITIAVVDTGADLSAPDLATKTPATYSTLTGSSDVSDANGHGTFVSSLAAGSVTNGDGVAGFGGDAKLLVVQAGSANGSFTDLDEAAGVTYAVDHGAKIINLSIGGPATSSTEQRAVDYAAAHGVLLVAAAGNSYQSGNPVMYPAALIQPDGSNGQGGVGLAVGASDGDGMRAPFSSTGSFLSLAAPGVNVFGALSSLSSPSSWPRTLLPGSSAGVYGFGSGTSFAAPEVAGAAALVWAANPSLQAEQVATILKETASGRGSWNPELGYGVVDVASAVARAQGTEPATSVVQAAARLTLRVSRTQGAGPLLVRLTARLAPTSPSIAPAGRLLMLESFGGTTWERVGRARTDARGTTNWTVTLRRGAHRLRVRFAGASDLASATSARVSVRVR